MLPQILDILKHRRGEYCFLLQLDSTIEDLVQISQVRVPLGLLPFSHALPPDLMLPALDHRSIPTNDSNDHACDILFVVENIIGNSTRCSVTC